MPLADGNEQQVPNAYRWTERLRRNFAVQDVVVVAYHAYMFGRSIAAGASQAVGQARALFAVLLGATAAAVLLVRGELLPAGKLRAALYRVALIASLPASYVGLGSLFTALDPARRDLELLAIDRAIFGGTPALWLTRFNVVTVNEWFSFFYQGYYALLAAGLVLPPLLDHGRRLEETVLGTGLTAMVGHVVYTLVPGAGPYATIAFAEPIHGGTCWSVVADTVRAEGVLDAFPSVHTAIPVLFTLLAFRHRRHRAIRWLWLPLGFVTLQIVIATMLLRWHWGVDILAGLLLAVAVFMLVSAVHRYEHERRRDGGRQPVWEPLSRS